MNGNSFAARTRRREEVTAAAASLKSAFTELGAAFDAASNAVTTFTFDASGSLQTQIEGGAPVDAVRSRIHDKLKALNPFYADLETVLQVSPLRLTLLEPGTFRAYYLEQQAAGADLAHLKPPRMGAPDATIADLLRLSGASS